MSKKRGLQKDEKVSDEVTPSIEEAIVSNDPVADLFAGDTEPEDEFPDGFVHFATNIRWFGSYVIESYLTTTGKRYEIHREGTKVDIKDMDALRKITTTVYCLREERYFTVHPVGVTSI